MLYIPCFRTKEFHYVHNVAIAIILKDYINLSRWYGTISSKGARLRLFLWTVVLWKHRVTDFPSLGPGESRLWVWSARTFRLHPGLVTRYLQVPVLVDNCTFNKLENLKFSTLNCLKNLASWYFRVHFPEEGSGHLKVKGLVDLCFRLRRPMDSYVFGPLLS